MKGQYPYKLQTLASTNDDIKDGNGDFIITPESWVDVCNCRDEEGRRFVVKTPDGLDYVSTVVVFAPKGTLAVAPGVTIRILDCDTIRVQMKVMASRREQLHTRIWV